MLVPVERLVFRVLFYFVVAECQPCRRLGIEQGSVEGVELVVFDDDGSRPAAVEKSFLLFQCRNFGIDGNDSIGELEHIGQGIDELVFADDKVAHGAGLVPPVAVAADSFTFRFVQYSSTCCSLLFTDIYDITHLKSCFHKI